MLWDFIRRRSSNRLNSNPEWEKNTWNIDYYDEKKPVTNMWNETIKTNFIRKNQQQQHKTKQKLNICVLNYIYALNSPYLLNRTLKNVGKKLIRIWRVTSKLKLLHFRVVMIKKWVFFVVLQLYVSRAAKFYTFKSSNSLSDEK